MKNMQKILLIVATIIFTTQAQAMMYLRRPYEPNMGRWLTRDPFGEIGFHVSAEGRQPFLDPSREDSLELLNKLLVQPGDPNLYVFVGNEPIQNIDALGLLKFKGCTPDEQSKLSSQFTEYCNKMTRPEFACCVGHFNIPQRLRGICDNQADITIECVHNYTRMCDPGTCSWSYPGSQTVHLCPDGLSQSGLCSDPYGCHLVHELAHMIGHPFEKWPMKVEHCLGCKY
jgi:hypothetical protein